MKDILTIHRFLLVTELSLFLNTKQIEERA